MGHLIKSLQAEMKLIIAFCLILIATVSAQEDVCEMCKLGVGIFWGHLRTEQAMRHQRQHLIQDVCPHHGPQQHVCEDVINVHWKEINHVIYNDNTIPKVCRGITGQECMKMNEREWDCDTCMGAVAGKLYCQNPILALSEEDQAHCADMVSMFTGPAMRSLDAEYSGHAQLYCHFWYDGVCPQPSNSWLF